MTPEPVSEAYLALRPEKPTFDPTPTDNGAMANFIIFDTWYDEVVEPFIDRQFDLIRCRVNGDCDAGS